MEYPQENGTGTPISKHKQRRCHERSLNLPTLERMGSEYYSTEDLAEAEMSYQYQNPVKPVYTTFTRTTPQPTIASHKTQAQHSKRLVPLRVEQEEYYESYYMPQDSPVAGSNNTYAIYEQDPVRDQPDDGAIYEDMVDEEGEEEEDEIEVYDYGPYPAQKERLPRKEKYYLAREVPFSETYPTHPRRHRKSSLNNYDMQQISYVKTPNTSRTRSVRPRSPTRQQMSEPIYSKWPQNKPGKLATSSCYDAEGRLYIQSHSPKYDYNDRRQPQPIDNYLQRKEEITKRLEELQQRREEGLRQIYAKKEALLKHGNDEPTKQSQQYLSPKELAEGEVYFKNLKAMFRDVASDVERLTTRKDVDSQGRKAKSNSPTETFHPKN